jgi:hypothetical protein
VHGSRSVEVHYSVLSLSRIDATSATGAQVPLSQFASITSTVAPIAINHQGQFLGDTELQPLSRCLDRRRGNGDPAGSQRAALATLDCHQFSGQRAGVSELAEQHADPDPRRI